MTSAFNAPLRNRPCGKASPAAATRIWIHSAALFLGIATLLASVAVGDEAPAKPEAPVEEIPAQSTQGIHAPAAADVDLFGDSIVRKVKVEEVQAGGRQLTITGGSDANATVAKAPAGYRHTIVFQDGRELRGEMQAMTKDEVIWRRPDVTGVLHFARSQVRWIQLTDKPIGASERAAAEALELTPDSAPPHEHGSLPSVKATVKLPGADWLFGDIKSDDGQSFTIQISPETTFHLTRNQVGWLYFDTKPAPAHGFYGRLADTGSWICSGDPADVEVNNGRLTLDNQSIGHEISGPPRFELSFEVASDYESGTTLELQPAVALSPIQGSIEIACGRNEISHITHNFNGLPNTVLPHKTPLPPDQVTKEGPVSYRLFYSLPDEKIVLFRNGKKLTDWSLKEGHQGQGNDEHEAIQPIFAFFFHHRNDIDLRLNRVTVQPWDGVFPGDEHSDAKGDKLSQGVQAPAIGTLGSISANEFAFSGKTQPIKEGTFIELQELPVPSEEPDTTLMFGDKGEISLSELHIEDGRIHGHSSLGADLDAPMESVETIAFEAHKPVPATDRDLLVFKNGEELPGDFLAAGPDGHLHWKTGGQVFELTPERVQGVRFAAPIPPAPAPEKTASIELRNGDQWPVELAGIDDKNVRIRHSLFGEQSIPRDSVWKLYPAPEFPSLTASDNSESWVVRESDAAHGVPSTLPSRWNYLDGTYFPRSITQVLDDQDATAFQPPLQHLPSRFELSFNVTDPSGDLPSFNFNLATEDDNASVSLSASGGEMEIAFTGSLWQHLEDQEISLASKLPDPTSRVGVRLFVDSGAGTVDLLVNGVHVARLGHSPSTRTPGAGAKVTFGCDTTTGETLPILSDVHFAPWNGEIPAPDEKPKVSLENGDTAAGHLKEVRNDKVFVESDVGLISFPMTKVQAIEFGGTPHPENAPARVHLRDGSTVHLDRYQWDGEKLTGHSTLLGDVTIPRASIAELIVQPPPARFPSPLRPKKPDLSRGKPDTASLNGGAKSPSVTNKE